jgi:hypothetical protein
MTTAQRKNDRVERDTGKGESSGKTKNRRRAMFDAKDTNASAFLALAFFLSCRCFDFFLPYYIKLS